MFVKILKIVPIFVINLKPTTTLSLPLYFWTLAPSLNEPLDKKIVQTYMVASKSWKGFI